MAEPLSDDVLTALEQAAEKATPGPWACWNGWGPGKGTGMMAMRRIGPATSGGVSASAYVDDSDGGDIYATREDAEHIALACPSTVLALVAEVRRLRQENARRLDVQAYADALQRGRERSARET